VGLRSLLHSTVALVTLVVLVGLAFVQTCQLDRIERRLNALEGAPIRAASALPHGTAPDDRALLADPTNLLEPFGRPYVRAATVARGGTLRVEMPADPKGMSPYLASGADVVELDRYLNNRLAVRIPGDYDNYAPDLAVHVSSPDDGFTYRIRLRPGVLWNKPAVEGPRYAWLEGPHPLTSDDFIFVLDMMRNTQITGRISSYRTYFEALESYRAIDALTFEVKFKEKLATNLLSVLDLSPSPRWLFMFDEDGKPIEPAQLNTHWYLSKGIGTGPYRFVSWTPGTMIELARNEAYWGEPPAFDKVLMRIVKDPAAWPRLLKIGDLDLIRLQPEQYRAEVLEAKGPILGEPRIKQARGTEMGYLFVAWNQARPFFADEKVRQAMTLALDRQGIVDKVFYGLGRVTTGPFPQESPCYDRSIEPWPYDLVAAAKKLDEAGWIDGDGDGIRDKVIHGNRVPFAFDLMVYGSLAEWTTFASVYKEALALIGVRMKPVAIEWSAMLKRLDERDFDAHTGAWVQSWEIDLNQIWHSSEADRPKSSNRIGYRDEASDKIIEALRRELDPAKRVELCHAFHARVHQQQPYTFLYQRDRAYLYWDYLNTPEISVIHPNRDLRYLSFREPRP